MFLSPIDLDLLLSDLGKGENEVNIERRERALSEFLEYRRTYRR